MTLFPEFPDYDDNITIPNGWVDVSWHNDICPHLEKPLNPVSCVAIWCDYKEYARRELGSIHRFTVAVQDDMEKTDLGFFDDFDNALLFANALHNSLVSVNFDYNKYYPTEKDFPTSDISEIIVKHDMVVTDELLQLAKACWAEAKIHNETQTA